ncbi:MAG: 30S ribosomal protein S9 [Candidatus Nanoarchaeia archaeon]
MKVVHRSGIRKRAVARATVKEGKGIIKVNNSLIDYVSPELSKMKMLEPIILAEDIAKKIDISVNVNGGGYMSQAEAVRLAISRAILDFTNDSKLKETFLDYDRQLMVADVRRKEMCKPNDSKARAKRQKSYR